MTTIPEKRIGLAFLTMTEHMMQQYLPDLEPPLFGAITPDGALSVAGNFEVLHKQLWLPEPYTNYKIVGLYYNVLFRYWNIIYEDQAIPVPPPNTMIPEMRATYTQGGAGSRPVIASIELVRWD